MKLSVAGWIYKPSRAVVIWFIIISLVICYASQTFLKREFLSAVSENIKVNKQNKVDFYGVVFSVVNKNTNEINTFLYNPLVNWKVPGILFLVFIVIGAGIIFTKSKMIGLERDKAECGKKIKDLEDDIRWKNRKISELQTDVQNTSAENDKFRRTLAQYREAHEAMKQENATIKEQCRAELEKKDQEHAVIIKGYIDKMEDMQITCVQTIQTMKKELGGPPQTGRRTV